MTKLIYIIDNLHIGGAQLHLLRLVDKLSQNGYSVQIVCLGESDPNISAANIAIRKLKMDCVWKPYFWRDFFRLIIFLKKEKPAIVHTYLNTSNVFGIFAAKLASVPVVVSSRRDLGHFRSSLIGKLEEFTARLSDKVVCVSEAVRENLARKEGISADKAVVICNGVDPQDFKYRGSRTHQNCFNIAMVSSMDRKEKGHAYFIEAAEAVIAKRKDIKFTLIGNGPLKPHFEQEISSKGLTSYFDFRGTRNDLHKELADVDMLVVPSESEGCSNALLEAMALGIPVVATAVEGNLEVIEDEIYGYLVKPKDSRAIAKKLLEILESPEKMSQIGSAARKRIEDKFSLQEMVKNYAWLYENLLEGKANKIGYVVSLFPCWSETFILNELLEVEKRGFNITIFSIRRDLEDFTQENAKPLLKKTKYITYPGLIVSLFYWLIKKPLVILGLFCLTLTTRQPTFAALFKNLWCILAGARFSRIAQKERLRHIHAHFATYPAFVAIVISKLTNIPFTFTVHAHDIFLDKSLLKEKAEAAKAIVAISDYNKQYLDNYSGNGVYLKTRVVHCGVDLLAHPRVFRREGNTENVIVSIGRLSRMKGFHHLINACRLIKGRIPFKCYIAGDGPIRPELEVLIRQSGLSDNVILLGVLDNIKIKELLDKASVFVLPSVWDDKDGQDGIPVVLMEAMAQGVPVISSRISGIPELIQDKETGLLIDPGNEEELAEKIFALINDKNLQARLSSSARLKIENDFNISKSADGLAEIFQPQACPIRALFIIWSLERGGAERFLVSLLKAIDRKVIAPTVCCLNWKGDWAKEIEDIGIKVIALNKKNGLGLAAFIKLVKFIRREKFQIVNTHLWGADVMGRVAAILAGVPIIVSTAQNVDIWKKWQHKLVDRLLFRKTNMLIAVSEAVKEYYHKEVGIPEEKIRVIPNAIEPERFSNIGDVTYLYDELNLTAGDFILVCAGRLTEQKGQSYLLEAIKNLRLKYGNLRVIFAGDGEDREKLINLADNLEIIKMVRFVGQRKDIPQILHLSDGLVLPSLYEGLPVCVLEAMAAGKAVIATDAGGTSAVVKDNENGYLVPARDSDALSCAIEKLINLADKGRHLGEKAREFVINNFSIKPAAKKTADLFYALKNRK